MPFVDNFQGFKFNNLKDRIKWKLDAKNSESRRLSQEKATNDVTSAMPSIDAIRVELNQSSLFKPALPKLKFNVTENNSPTNS